MKKLLLMVLCFIMILSLTSCENVKSVRAFAWAYTYDDIDSHYEALGKIGGKYFGIHPWRGSQILAGYTDINYSYQHTYFLFSNKQESYSTILFAEYSSETYEERKSTILSSYEFLEETDVSYDGKKYESLPAEFTYGGYRFKTLEKKEGFIGFNDEKFRIAFCYYGFVFLGFDTYGRPKFSEFGSTKLSEDEMAAEFIDDFFYWNDKK